MEKSWLRFRATATQRAPAARARARPSRDPVEWHGNAFRRNQHEIPNYGERHRCGEAISSATAKATVNHAHLLLQIRTRVLNGDLEGDFARW